MACGSPCKDALDEGWASGSGTLPPRGNYLEGEQPDLDRAKIKTAGSVKT